MLAQLSEVLKKGPAVLRAYSEAGHFLIEVADEAAPSHAPATLITGGVDHLFDTLIKHIDGSRDVDLAVAFALESGVAMLEPYLEDLLDRGGALRIVVGDYLDISEPAALRRLSDLRGRVSANVYETGGGSFHPKAWFFRAADRSGAAIVGSSNLSRTALTTGVEWNLRTVAARDWQPALAAFEALLLAPQVKPLTPDWIDSYVKRRRHAQLPTFARAVVAEDVPLDRPEPHEIQREALVALGQSRAAGHRAGMVVLATGLGKTWLSAFDSAGFDRVLFLAHREEILHQAVATFRRIRPEARFGLFTGQAKTEGELLFASIQTLGRPEHLQRFDPQAFDYIVVDEFHHASAASYRQLIDHFRPKFLLGLTATPDRTDGADLLMLCGDNLVYRCDLFDGIGRGYLSPFHYYGVADDIDYEHIPWRSHRFDEEALTRALATQARAQNALEQFNGKRKGPAIGFCVSRRHAEFLAHYFSNAGLRAVAVHSGADSAPRTSSLEALRRGELDILFAVDMFNEGVDVPQIGTVMMLRPTESAILFLQQLGRGLRKAENKVLKVIDYIGNHRSFLTKARTLLAAGDGDRSTSRRLDELLAGTMKLPPGCSITYELAVIEFLRRLLPARAGQEEGEAWYRAFVLRERRRPQAVEFARAGFDPSKSGHGTWLDFVRDMSDAVPRSGQTFAALLKMIEITPFESAVQLAAISTIVAEVAVDRLDHVAVSQALGATAFRLGARLDIDGTAASDAFAFWARTPHVRVADHRLDLARGGDREGLIELVDELVTWRLSTIRDVKSQTGVTEESSAFQISPVLWEEYSREEIPALFGTTFNPGNWNSGIVRVGKALILLTTLKKGSLATGNHYEDRFLSPSRMEWQSQTQTTRASERGRLLSGQVRGTHVHLFVRSEKLRNGKAAPFVYLGQPTFAGWRGEKPITITWELQSAIPVYYHRMLGVPKPTD
ncbi:DUF3427 domain-containing protein [Geminicoccaceae bacterium 1502E]|nr:DUF3427 domain-containing protein [Geminicoccaceae bacterium 1502E]